MLLKECDANLICNDQFTNVGDVNIGNPSCALSLKAFGSVSSFVFCMVKGTDSGLFGKECQPAKIGADLPLQTLSCTQWVTIGLPHAQLEPQVFASSSISDPSCTTYSQSGVFCGVIAAGSGMDINSDLWVVLIDKPYNEFPFQPTNMVAYSRKGPVVGDPSCTMYPSSRAVCAVRNTSSHFVPIDFGYFPGIGNSHSFAAPYDFNLTEKSGIIVIDDPSCTWVNVGGVERVICAVVGSDSRLYEIESP